MEITILPTLSLVAPSSDVRQNRDPDYVAKLADDLKVNGMKHPIYVRQVGKQYEVVTGETRRQAGLQAGLETVPCVIVTGELSEGDLLRERLLENEMRQNMSPVERAKAYQDLMRLNKWSQADLAKAIHETESTVSKVLKISQLAAELHDAVSSGKLPFTVAVAIARLPEHKDQADIADAYMKGLLTRDAVEVKVSQLLRKTPKRQKAMKARTPQGLQLIIPPLDFETILAEIAALVDAVKKAQKFGLPVESIPAILREA